MDQTHNSSLRGHSLGPYMELCLNPPPFSIIIPFLNLGVTTKRNTISHHLSHDNMLEIAHLWPEVICLRERAAALDIAGVQLVDNQSQLLKVLVHRDTECLSQLSLLTQEAILFPKMLKCPAIGSCDKYKLNFWLFQSILIMSTGLEPTEGNKHSRAEIATVLSLCT